MNEAKKGSKNSRIAIFAYSRTGKALAKRVEACFLDTQVRLCTTPRLADSEFHPEASAGENSVAGSFELADALIFIGALGIAVRKIAPFVKDKTRDPAVLCLDERGQFVISVLSGHIGGANELAEKLARELGCIPVITTATDINHRFSVDTWARQQGLVIGDMKMAKAISAAILEQDVYLESDFPVQGNYPPGCIVKMDGSLRPPVEGAGGKADGEGYKDYGILISYRVRTPFAKTLRLIPKILHLGIGCRKGISKDAISEAVFRLCEENHIDIRAIQGVYSITLKAEENGLLEFCRERNWPFHVYSAEELMQVPGEFTASEFVRKTTGADNICERAAMIGADHLILPKTALNGVTVALAAEEYHVIF